MRNLILILMMLFLVGAVQAGAATEPNDPDADLSEGDVERLNAMLGCTDKVFLPRSGDKCVIEDAKCLEYRVSVEGNPSASKRGAVQSAWRQWKNRCKDELQIDPKFCNWGEARGKRYVCAELVGGQYRYRAIATPCLCRNDK